MALWRHGQMVEFDGMLAAVVGTDADPWVPEDHVALWFGLPRTTRLSAGGLGGSRPEVWTVPEVYCTPAAESDARH